MIERLVQDQCDDRSASRGHDLGARITSLRSGTWRLERRHCGVSGGVGGNNGADPDQLYEPGSLVVSRGDQCDLVAVLVSHGELTDDRAVDEFRAREVDDDRGAMAGDPFNLFVEAPPGRDVVFAE